MGLDKTWVAEIMAMLEQYANTNPDDPAPFSFLFVTNFAWHYKGSNIAGASENMFIYIPGAPFQISRETFDAIGRAIKDYGNCRAAI